MDKTKNSGFIRLLYKLSILSLVLNASVTLSAEIEAAFNIGVGYTDNLGRDFEDKVDEMIGTAGFDFELNQSSRRVNAMIRANLEYLYYDNDQIDDEVVGGVDALLDFAIIEEILEWTIQDNFGQQLQDPFLPSEPGNRENINFFTTGPTLHVPMGNRHEMLLRGRYNEVNYEISPFDNTGWSAGAQFGRAIRENMLLSVNGNFDTTEFDNDGLSEDYDRREYFLQLSSQRGRDDLFLDIGYTELDLGDRDSNGGNLVRFSWTRALTPVSQLTFSAGSDFASQSDRLRYVQSNQLEVGDTVDIDGDDVPFRSNRVSVGYNFLRERTSFDIGLEWLEEDYEGVSNRNRENWRTYLSVSRDLSRRTFGQLNIHFSRREYFDLAREDDDTSVSIVLGINMSERTSFSIEYQLYNRNSNENTGEFTENRAFLLFTYVPEWGK